ncbi:MAG: urease accessory protein UreD [Chitinophagaceae bacterium]|nr:urease accessory protein UreD [Chitinophagaceae bacterium]
MKSSLHIQVAGRSGISFLQEAFFTTPLKVMNITEDKTDHQLQLMLMSSSPGILDGDEYDLKIEIEESCSLQLHTQAYQRLFTMKKGATQIMNVYIEEGGSFYFLPHPSVPHDQSIFTSHNNFYLGNNSKLIFCEILTCGRKLNGELFAFSKYHSISQVYINNKLIIKENLLVQPSLVNVHTIGQLEGYTHQASMIWLQDGADVKSMQQGLLSFLSTKKNMEVGITAAPVNGLIIRLLGNGGEQLYDCLKSISVILKAKESSIDTININH